jgi:drug/metabolite transporter (DMT)-like permease
VSRPSRPSATAPASVSPPIHSSPVKVPKTIRQKRLTALMPMLFVALWSTGFIVAKFGLPYAPPLTFLTLRFGAVVLLMLPVVMLTRAPWPTGKVSDIALSGVLLHAGYISGVWCAIRLGMPAGLAALIAGMQPILTAFAAPLIGEQVRKRQWFGLLFGLSGVTLVVSSKINISGLSLDSIGFGVFGLMAITIGTLYQKYRCPHFDLRSGTLIQYMFSTSVMLPLAIYFEGLDWHLSTVHWTIQFVAALLWAVFVLSIGAVFLLFSLIRKSAATSVTSLLYLTPATTALMAWAMFGEALSINGLIGMMLAILGVAFVIKK